MSEERDFEAEARVDGWVSQEEWKGDPNKWIPAEDFVKRGETIRPIVQAKFRKSLATVEDLRREMETQKGVFGEFQKFQEQALAKANKEREDAIAQLEVERKKAISEGDGDAFDRADKKLQDLRQAPVKEPPKENPEVASWKAENTWYGSDRALTAIADGLSDVVKAENPGLRGKAFLDKLTERVKSEVPHKFENPRRQEQLTGDGQRKGNSKAKSYENLPADARAACDKFVKTIPGFTVEKYLATYSWEQ